MTTKPWEPAPLLPVSGKDPNYVYRWVRLDNLDKAMVEGWDPVKGVNKGKEEPPPILLLDGTQIDSAIRKRNLILCKMPKELADKRNAYYQARTDSLLEAQAEKFKEEVGGRTYGGIKVVEGTKK
jgi:hypothetical protein